MQPCNNECNGWHLGGGQAEEALAVGRALRAQQRGRAVVARARVPNHAVSHAVERVARLDSRADRQLL